MWKKRIALLLSLICILVLLQPSTAGAIAAKTATANASDPTNLDMLISPQMSYTNSFTTILTIDKSSGTAYSAAIFTGYSHLTTKIQIRLTLQKRGLLGLWWTDVETWTGTFYRFYGDMERVRPNLKKGTYRAKGTFTAYSGNDSESYTLYSENKKY
ncbi:MAG TPA: hypothetical protein VFD33_08305 [Bacillota bacterium]|nr:hypothetical protein [Bacillota bacterium]